LFVRIREEIERHFAHSEGQARVAMFLLRWGLSVKAAGAQAPRIYLGELQVPYRSVARACRVDWRTVREAARRIAEHPQLGEFFARLENAGPFFRGVTKLLGYRCIVVETAKDQPGILAYIAGLLAEKGINILQVVAEHPLIVDNPKLYVIIESEVPGDFVPRALQHPAIKSVTVY